MSRLEGKTAIVTGAARGTGAVIAQMFRDEGAVVVATDIADGDGIVKLDVTNEAHWDEVVSGMDQVDVLVNNAAVLHMGPIERTSAEKYRQVLDVNLVGPFLGMRAVVGPMRAAGGGSIVNISSIDGLIGMNGISAYGSSKFGLGGLMRCSALELGRSGIRVNNVCPAGGNPAMYAQWFDQMMSFMEQTAAYSDNRGIPGEVPLECIAAAALFLASDESSHITGVDLPVDGGAAAGVVIEGLNSLE
ncbi:SDR family NAD(P)-dependent oxidoreductase [Candidatus Poriferisocius sp.]|uniref:SDR family NAD(P)-dependent oxidoreductase n=1 Tax=Candidatus Poriferisocius sp. TaxID=3101276 RepID=UPI003B518702